MQIHRNLDKKQIHPCLNPQIPNQSRILNTSVTKRNPYQLQ